MKTYQIITKPTLRELDEEVNRQTEFGWKLVDHTTTGNGAGRFSQEMEIEDAPDQVVGAPVIVSCTRKEQAEADELECELKKHGL